MLCTRFNNVRLCETAVVIVIYNLHSRLMCAMQATNFDEVLAVGTGISLYMISL